jgi:O-antigen/teichoic acid export membrane protein
MEKQISVAQSSIRSGAWMFARQFAIRMINLVVIAILARHISPASFGLVALAQVVLQFLVLSQTNGIGTYVIYDRAPGWENRSNSAFWLNFFITVVELGILFGTLPIIVSFYVQPEMPYVLAVLGATYFIHQLGIVPDSLTQRKLRFRPIVIRDTLLSIFSGILGVAMALAGWGVWSLVIPTLIIQPINVVASFAIARWRPQLHLGLRDWLPIAKYSVPLIGTGVLGLVLNDADTLIVGRVLGSQSLGFYNVAWNLSNLAGRNITGVVGAVAMPALAMVGSDITRLQDAYRRMLRLLGLVTFPALFVLFALADDVVRLVYGPDWEPVVNLVRIFIIFTVVRSVTSPSGIIYNVIGRSDIGLKFNLGFLPFYLIAIFWGSQEGIVGVAIGVTAVRTIGAIIALAISTNLIHLPFVRAITPLFLGAIISLVVAALAWGMNFLFIASNITLVIRLALCLGIAGLLYGVGLALFDREAYKEVIRLISSILPRPMMIKLAMLKRNILFAKIK